MEFQKIQNIIRMMSREQFELIMHKIIMSYEFSALMSVGAENISAQNKLKLYQLFKDVGIDLCPKDEDSASADYRLEAVAHYICMYAEELAHHKNE